MEKLLVTIGDDAGDPVLTTITEFEYDRNGNSTSRVEYDWVTYGNTTGTAELRTTRFDYYFPHPAMGSTTDVATGYWREHHSTYWSDDLDPRRMNALLRVTTSEDGTTPAAATEFEYDDPYGTGNVTAEEFWDDEKAEALPSLGSLSSASARVVTRTYNSLGQVSEVDGDTVNTEITYGTIPGGSGPGPYPTLVQYAPGTGIARTFSFDWDYGTGFLDAETDDDNSIETAYTYDALGRTLTVDEDGLRQTAIVYDDDDGLVITKSDLVSYQDGKHQSVTHYDQLGRVVRTRVTDGSTLSTSPSATDGINVETIYTTVSGGNRVVTSTPYRTTSDLTLEWGCTQYDRLGRVVQTAAFYGSTAPADCTATGSTGDAEVVYDGNRIQTTDPAETKRDEYRDALGRIVQVVEDPGGTLDYETGYTYDPLGNLETVVQGVQTRTFAYSALGRLISADNPESGEIAYTYGDDGSLATVTDARGIVSSYIYDALGRITVKSYSDLTPDVAYSYYTTGAPNIGHLSQVASALAVETFNGYDALGRVTSHTQAIFPGSTAYTMAYTYWLDDGIATMTYPSGRVVGYAVDDAGRPRVISDGTTTYADLNNAVTDYAPDGRIARMELGNELWETRDYRPAGTATTLKLGTTSGGSEKLGLAYNYSSTAHNGNLQSHVITHPGSTWTQTFGYDNVNRLSSASETSGFSRTYGYDPYGNRWVSSSSGVYHADTHEPTSSTNFSTSTNRLGVASSTYDAAGNQTFFAPYDLVFDAENRIAAAVGNGTSSGAVYTYDGDGRRVSKTWFPGGGTPAVTHYVYDIAGRNIAEYSSEPPASDGTFWLFADLLGSIRAVTGEKPPTESAPVLECYDYLPFGRMLTAQDNGRGTSASCYPGSPTGYTSVLDEKFTGQERDEIQLDYLIARYVSTAQGRFTSADLPFMDQHPGDPQSWNLYAYARNNPLRYVDPFGYQSVECADGLDGCVLTVDAITRTNSGDRSLLELWLFVLSYRVRDVAEIATEVAYTATDVAVNYVTAPRNPGCMALATGIGIVGGTDIGATIGGGIGLAGIAAGVLATVPAGAVIGGTGGGLLGSYAGYGAGWTLCAQMSGSGGGGRGPNPNEPSVAQLDMFERQLADHGRRSLERSRRSIERRLQEHLRKLDGMRSSGGYTSSVEREISNFQRELEAIRRVLQGGRMDSQADIARLAKLFERVERLRTFGSHEDPESWALAHTLVDISESCEKICRSMVPALMRTQDEQAIEDSLHDIGEELRHIHYHIKLSRFYRYLQDKVQ